MRCELVAVGTELLLGQIANTNAQWMSERLAEVGVEVLHHQVVGDNHGRIVGAIELTASRADAVILTGGLGPTGDDITRDALAAFLGTALERDASIEDALRARFASLGREMPLSNLVQADVPRGARPIRARLGTAPGLAAERAGVRLYALPGVPAEMRDMMEQTVLPELAALAGPAAIVSRVIRCTGIAESRTGELLDDLFRESRNPTIAYLAGGGEVRVRLTARGDDRAAAEAAIAPVADEVLRRLGDVVFSDRGEDLEAAVVRLLAGSGRTLAAAESLTGGEFGARVTSVPGASAVFLGSAVCYATGAKAAVLGIDPALLAREGVVSEACAAAMASGARERFGADVAVAMTGVAGPEPQEGVEPGTVWLALDADGTSHRRMLRTPGERAAVRRWATTNALDLVRRFLEGRPLPGGPAR
ncbi:MAG: competence/damage-inducible protein A [Actinomycetota bacterium]